MTSAVLDPTEPPEKRRLRRLVESTIAAWRDPSWDSGPLAGAALRVLDEHPALAAHHSLLLDLAVEEYCLRRDRGEPLDPAAYAAQFPHVGPTLGELLEFYTHGTPTGDDTTAPPTFDWPVANEVVRGFLILHQLGRGANSRAYLASEIAIGGRLVVLKISTQLTNEAVLLGTLTHPNITPILSHHVAVYSHARNSKREFISFIATPFLGATTLRDAIHSVWKTAPTPHDVRTLVAVTRDGALGVDKFHPYPPAAWFAIDTTYCDAAVDILIRIADALHFAHSAGVLHRDIKPSNILLTPTGTPMLMDFGVSISAHSASDSIAGTLSYMAPECIAVLTTTTAISHDSESECSSTSASSFDSVTSTTSNARPSNSVTSRTDTTTATSTTRPNHTTASDIYSLGAVAFELLTGTPPHGRPTPHRHFRDLTREISERQKSGPISADANPDNIDAGLFRILRRCLANNPNDRPPTAGALAAELTEYQRKKSENRKAQRQRDAGRKIAVVMTITISLLVTGFFALPPPLPQRFGDLRATVEQLLRAGNGDHALTVLDTAITRHEDLTRLKHNGEEQTNAIASHTAVLRLLRGETLRKLGKYREADKEFLRVVALRRDAAALVRCAYVKQQIGDSSTALGVYTHAVKPQASQFSTRYPRDLAVAQNNMAVILMASGDIDLAEQSLAKISLVVLRPQEAAIVARNRMDVSIGLFDAGILDVNDLRKRMDTMFSHWPSGILDHARSLISVRVNERVRSRSLPLLARDTEHEAQHGNAGDVEGSAAAGGRRTYGYSEIHIDADSAGFDLQSRVLVPDDLPDTHYDIGDH